MRIVAVNGQIATVVYHLEGSDATQVFTCTLQNNGTLNHIAKVKRVAEGKYVCIDTGKEYRESAKENEK